MLQSAGMRSVAITILLCVSVLFLPVWASIALCIVAVFVTPQRLVLFIPAVLSDALFAPIPSIAPSMMLMTLLVAVLLVVQWLLVSQTRALQMIYGVEAN